MLGPNPEATLTESDRNRPKPNKSDQVRPTLAKSDWIQPNPMVEFGRDGLDGGKKAGIYSQNIDELHFL